MDEIDRRLKKKEIELEIIEENIIVTEEARRRILKDIVKLNNEKYHMFISDDSNVELKKIFEDLIYITVIIEEAQRYYDIKKSIKDKDKGKKIKYDYIVEQMEKCNENLKNHCLLYQSIL